MTAHAACSPSSAAMWLNCPASITKTKGITRPSSKYAREGTAAHSVAEMTLKGDVFLPDKVTVEGDEFIVSRGMCLALNGYVSYVQGLVREPGVRKVLLEHRVAVPKTHNMVWGTLDCGVHTADGSIEIADLKFGKGVAVHPDGPQLKLYALGFAGLVMPIGLDTRVTLTICQPRVAGGEVPRQHEMRYGDLVHWRGQVVEPAIRKIKDGDETEHAGTHCRWCVRQTECATYANRHQTKAASVFDDGDQKDPFA